MSDPICPCDVLEEPELDIAAGLDALPRQLRTFAEVRQALLQSVAKKPALAAWRARGGRDLGVMWLEMWAYLSDVLAFYDERIANETYVRTAQRRESLRRIIDQLGYLPVPGVAGRAVLAALAEGKNEVRLPPGVGLRSDAFEQEAPQLFETELESRIHPAKNQWQIGPIRRGTLPQRTPAQAAGQRGAGTPTGKFLVFETAGLSLAKDQLALFEFPDGTRAAGKVKAVVPFNGKDNRTYAEVEFVAPIAIPNGTRPEQVQVRMPTVTATVSKNPLDVSPARAAVYTNGRATFALLDSVYRQLQVGGAVIGAVAAAEQYLPARVSSLAEVSVFQRLPQLTSPIEVKNAARLPVTQIQLDRALSPLSEPSQVTFHFGFVDGGSLAAVADDRIARSELSRSGGVPLSGLPLAPPDAKNGELNQEFLLVDADDKGALVTGRIQFDGSGIASFQALESSDLTFDFYRAPITVHGNLLETSRGESVFNEILGSGDPRTANQQFTLARKPLTYLFNPQAEGGIASTLDVKVDGVSWTEVRAFYGRGPGDQVFIVRHTADGDTVITFGDGVRGARVSAGVENVVASYRFGAGKAAPPAGAINQIARPFMGLRAVRSPVAAVRGRDPDAPELLRTLAPQSVLLFGRAVSVRDFQTLAGLSNGVEKASAEFVWLESEQRSGVSVTYIGQIAEAALAAQLRVNAEQNLPLFVKRAAARPSSLALDLVYDARFDPAKVVAAVIERLTHAEAGLLAPARAEIGGQFWISHLYREVHQVAGVIGVQSATLTVPAADGLTLSRVSSPVRGVAGTTSQTRISQMGSPGAVTRVLSLGPRDVICSPSGTYLDFSATGGLSVSAKSSAVPLDAAVRRPRED